jgi:hypothetical protein
MVPRTSKSSKIICAAVLRSHQRSTLSAARRILHKTSRRRLRRPLGIRNATNGARLEQPHAPALLQLPRTLAKPEVGEVDRQPIESAYPELARVPTEYIRKGLMVTGTEYVLDTMTYIGKHLYILL